MSTLKSLVSHPPSLPPHFTFAPSTLYLFLADIGHESLFHIGYLLTSPPPPATSTPFLAPLTGTIFHLTNTTSPSPSTYQTHTLPLPHLPKFIPTLLFILKLYPIDTILHPALSERLGILGLQAQLKSLEMVTPRVGTEGIEGIEGTEGTEGIEGIETTNCTDEPEQEKEEEEEEEKEEEEEEITCRSWIRSTLRILDEEGYISFPETIGPKIVVDSIEAEAVAGAMWNKMRGTVGWERSAWIGE